jgi:L-lactate dehydrogenase (cytochrome)
VSTTMRTKKHSTPTAAEQPPQLTIAAVPPGRKPPRVLHRVLALDDFEPIARRVLPKPVYGYASGGAETNAALRGNREVFDELAFVPRVLVNVAARTGKTTLFGHTYDAPFGIAPMGGTSLACYRGDAVLARSASEANIPMILSGASLTRLESVREAGNTAWFQAYLPGEAREIGALVDRVAQAGYDTLVLTVDVPVLANRENNVRNGYSAPLRPTLRLALDGLARPRWLATNALRTLLAQGMPHYENMGDRVPLISRTAVRRRALRDHLSWEHVELMRKVWHGRLVIKGLLHSEDARIARESGADGIIVSNHGGRQLDHTAPPLRVLPDIVKEAGEMAVMLDGGIRRGTDVLKALALGAHFVFVGRPFLYAAAVAGEPGVRHAIRLLVEEIHRDMALLGVTHLGEMNGVRLVPARGSFPG